MSGNTHSGVDRFFPKERGRSHFHFSYAFFSIVLFCVWMYFETKIFTRSKRESNRPALNGKNWRQQQLLSCTIELDILHPIFIISLLSLGGGGVTSRFLVGWGIMVMMMTVVLENTWLYKWVELSACEFSCLVTQPHFVFQMLVFASTLWEKSFYVFLLLQQSWFV